MLWVLAHGLSSIQQRKQERNMVVYIDASQQRKKLTMRIVMGDSTTFKVHRHGGGQKGGTVVEGAIEQE